MSSVLAIVSKALFEKMVPKNVLLGAVVDTSTYTSSNKTFDGLNAGGAIFLVTVRPPDEKLWLVGILESPNKKGDVWTAEANVAPLTDITSAISKFEFQSGTGLKAKKGALGMSLQTPRGLTEGDVKVLRGLVSTKPASGAKVHANDAYRAAVDAVVHKHKKGTKLGLFKLENKRKPFELAFDDLKDFEKLQLQSVFGEKTDLRALCAKKPKKGEEDEGDEMREMEVADVVETESGAVKYQLYIWPYGDGAIYAAGSDRVVCGICQHGLDPVDDLGKAWTRDFANAWLEGSKRLKMWTGHIDFDADELGEDDDD